ncbi:noggin-1-like [Hyperolius riggenbachi]|uniref:noggin-1-like n=1 Tax=Hyperolius riggenbachi TaxID=752182 RepID=UPI0035A2BBF6
MVPDTSVYNRGNKKTDHSEQKNNLRNLNYKMKLLRKYILCMVLTGVPWCPAMPDKAADPKRLEKTADFKRLEKTADSKRLEKTADPKRLEKTADPKRLEKTADPKRLEKTADPKRLEKTADPKRLEESQAEFDVGFLRRRLSSGTRPYSLSLSPLDYHYSPKPKHLRVPRLLRLLGSSFDPFWMSVEKPSPNDTNSYVSVFSQDLHDGATRYKKKLALEAQNIDFGSLRLPAELSENDTLLVLNEVRRWLVQTASCKLTSTWVDLGPVFWPRWVRHTNCDESHSGCSWPRGMVCRQAQLTQIKILAWHCWVLDSSKGWASQSCLWRVVPYPVVAACKCSCSR